VGTTEVGGGRLEMDTDAVRVAMERLTAAGTECAAEWGRLVLRITDNETGLGTNSASAAFRQQYEASVPVLKESVANVGPQFELFARNATDDATKYERADHEYQQRIQRLTGG
jgi:hypothetical protein